VGVGWRCILSLLASVTSQSLFQLLDFILKSSEAKQPLEGSNGTDFWTGTVNKNLVTLNLTVLCTQRNILLATWIFEDPKTSKFLSIG